MAAFRGNGLGVVIADYDDDGWPDVFVANDSMPNFLFRRLGSNAAQWSSGKWRFEEVALRAGVAVAIDGRARAGMGTDAGDYDGDGHLDLVVTNLDSEMHSLYRGLGRQLFAYATPESGIGPATLPFVGFGVVFFDFDNDMQLDLAFANGHIIDNPVLIRAGSTHAQRNQLFRNIAPRRFADVTASAGSGFALEKVSRGLWPPATSTTTAISTCSSPITARAPTCSATMARTANALLVRLVGTQSNRDGIGARLRLTTVAGAHADTRGQGRVELPGSERSAPARRPRRRRDGRSARGEVAERAGGGRAGLPADLIVTIREGDGVVGRQPFAPSISSGAQDVEGSGSGNQTKKEGLDFAGNPGPEAGASCVGLASA